MPMNLSTDGIAEMQGRLKFLRQFLLDEAVRESARAGAVVIRGAAKARAPVRVDLPTPKSTSRQPGEMRDAIKIVMTKVKDGTATASIGPRGRIKGLIAAVEYGHKLVKGGTRRRGKFGTTYNLGGKVIGQIGAKPFLRPAFDESAKAAIDASAVVMQQGIRKALS